MPRMRMSLRMRLTLWFVLIFSTIYLSVIGCMWLLYRDVSERAIYQRLIGLAEGVAMNMSEPGLDLSPGSLHRYQPMDRQHSILAVRDEAGKVIVSRWGVDTGALPAISAVSPSPDEPVLYSFEGETAKRLLGREISSLMITYRFTRPDGTLLYLDMARTTDMREQEQELFFNVFLLGAAGALLAAVVAAWMIAGRAVDPMRQFAEAAREVDPEHLETRLSVASTDHEVERMQTELNNALARLEEGYRSQERFISHAAHDLKTPIAVMLTETQVFNPAEASVEDMRTYHQSVMKEMRRLGSLVEGFLTLARADQGEALARRTRVPVNDLVLESIAHCTAQAQQAGVHLVPTLADPGDEDGCLDADPDLLRTMLENLIRNAVRYSPSGRPVEIGVDLDGGQCVLTVRDHGPGVPEDFHEKVFDRYFVIKDDSCQGSNGLGLGLAIAKSVAQLHGGTITLCNAEGGGCLCVITLPCEALSESV